MSDLVGNPEDRFSHNEAHTIWTVMIQRLLFVFVVRILQRQTLRGDAYNDNRYIVHVNLFLNIILLLMCDAYSCLISRLYKLKTISLEGERF